MSYLTTTMILASTAAIAHADISTQSFDYFWDYQGKDEFRSFDQFDTQGGTRELTGVQFRIEGTYSFSFIFENADANPLGAHQYDPSVNMNANIGLLNASIFMGSIATDFTALESTNLTASDGVAGSGPDSQFHAIDGVMNGSFDVFSSDLDTFVGNGSILFEQYFFPAIELPEGWFVGIQYQDHMQSGTFSVDYEYTTIPTQGTLAFGVLGLGAIARRRR